MHIINCLLIESFFMKVDIEFILKKRKLSYMEINYLKSYVSIVFGLNQLVLLISFHYLLLENFFNYLHSVYCN